MKTQISVFPWAKIGQNDHSNPYNIMRYLICGASKRIIIGVELLKGILIPFLAQFPEHALTL